jgi:signal transduction histidine kinase
MRGKDGEYRWFINQSIPRFDADGSYMGYIGCCIDVHERKLAEHAVEASERRYRSIFETAAVAMWESDFRGAKAAMDEARAGGVTDMRAYLREHPEFVGRCASLVKVRNVNDAAVRLADADSREHLITKFAELFMPETLGEFADELADLFEERGEYQRESVIRTLRGEVRRCMFTISLPPIANVDSVLAAVIDVTEQRTLEDALRRSEALNRAVLGSLKDLIAVLDGSGRIISVNHAWTDYASAIAADARTAGASIPGVGDNYLDALSHAAAAGATECLGVVNGIKRVLSGSAELFESEYRCPVAVEDIWLRMTVATLRGGWAGAVVALTDITARKEAQNLMQALNARLLRAQEDERRRLAREMHDDVTQRLAVLAIEAGRLEMQLTASCTGCDGTAAAAKVRHMTEQIVKLSTDVHAISRQLHPSILDDLGLADALESECHAFTDREGITVALEIAPLPDSIPNDLALCLYRILQEALRNMAKHAQTDRVRVSLSADGRREVVLRITDSGVGFHTPSVRTGPGLGLASMRERARLVGAELSVTSSPGGGTTIEVRAPLGPARTATANGSSGASSSSSSVASSSEDSP